MLSAGTSITRETSSRAALFVLLLWSLSCIRVRVYSPGADDDSVIVVTDSLGGVVLPPGLPGFKPEDHP